MIGSDSLSLLLRIKGDGSQARKEIKETKDAADSLGNAGGGDKLSSFLSSVGKSLAGLNFSSAEQGASSLTDKVDGLGTSLAGVAGPAGIAAGAIVGGMTAAAGAVVALGTVLFNLAKTASDYGDSIGDASDKTGLNIATLSALKYQADISGQSFEALAGAVVKFSRQLVEAAQGNDKAAESLKRLGIASPKKALDDLDASLATVIKNILQLPEAQQGAAAMSAFGKAGAELLPFLHDFNGNLPELIKHAKEVGAVLSEEDVAAAGEFEKSLNTLKAQATVTANTFANQFMPDITRGLNEVSKFFISNQNTVREWGSAIGKYLNDTLTEIKSQGGGWEAAGVVLARRFVDGFATIIVKGVTEAVYEAGQQARNWIINDLKKISWSDIIWGNFDPRKLGADIQQQMTQKPAQNSSGASQTFQVLEEGRQRGASLGVNNANKSSSLPQPDFLSGSGGKSPKVKKTKEELSPKAKAIIEEAGKLGISPLDYATIISFETAGTFSTSIQSTDKKSGKKYTGLIQFGPEEVGTYKVKRGEAFDAQLAKASEFLRDRFEAAKKSIAGANILDLYRTVLGGSPTASLTGKDSNGTSPVSGVQKMIREHMPGAMKLLGDKTATRFDPFKEEEAETRTAESRKKHWNEFVKDKSAAFDEELKRGKEIYEDKQKQLEEERTITEEIMKLRQDVIESERALIDFRAAQERKVLENSVDFARNPTERLRALEDLRRFDIEAAARKQRDAQEDIERERNYAESRLTVHELELGKREELDRLYDSRALMAKDEFEARKKEIEDSYKANADATREGGAGEGDLRGAAGVLRDVGTDLQGVMETIDPIGNVLASTFNMVANAVGNAVRSFVLFGSAGGGFKKFAAEVLASIAQMSVVQALFEAAQALAMGALFYFTGNPQYALSATAHSSAAVIYGIVGGVAAVTGRMAAGDSFKNQTSGGAVSGGVGSSLSKSNSTDTGSSQERTITYGRTFGQDQTKTIKFEFPRGMVQSHIIDDINSLGPIRNAIVNIVET